jgi:hypothetical protein
MFMFVFPVTALNKAKNVSYKKDSVLCCDTKGLVDDCENLKENAAKDLL